MGGRGDHVDLAEAGPVRDAGAQRPEPGAGRNDLRKKCVGRPKFFSRPVAQLRVSGCMHWVVVPLVNSTTREPHSAQWINPA